VQYILSSCGSVALSSILLQVILQPITNIVNEAAEVIIGEYFNYIGATNCVISVNKEIPNYKPSPQQPLRPLRHHYWTWELGWLHELLLDSNLVCGM
jgi:hypothetical protein